MKKLNKFGQLVLIAVLAVVLSMTACKQTAPSGGGGGGTLIEQKTFTAKEVSFKMNKISAVTNGTVGRSNQGDNGEHQVTLSEYYLGETEVTQELYKAIMDDNPSFFKDNPAYGEEQAKRPVEKVNWYDAVAFCNELTKVVTNLGVAQCVYYSDAGKATEYTKDDAARKKEPYMNMDKKGFRLPTEAEWEWVAQGGNARHKYAVTNENSKLDDYAWYTDNSGNKTHQVAKKEANSFGLYDMTGNVCEWCWDRYSASTPPGGNNPTGSQNDSKHILRGGCYSDNAVDCVVYYRNNSNPVSSINDSGFRLACRP